MDQTMRRAPRIPILPKSGSQGMMRDKADWPWLNLVAIHPSSKNTPHAIYTVLGIFLLGQGGCFVSGWHGAEKREIGLLLLQTGYDLDTRDMVKMKMIWFHLWNWWIRCERAFMGVERGEMRRMNDCRTSVLQMILISWSVISWMIESSWFKDGKEGKYAGTNFCVCR